MVLNIRIDDDVAVLSDFGRLLNDPRHFDAGRDVKDVLDRGYRKFILDLGGIREMGSTALGLLTTLTRQIRQDGGEAVLASRDPVVEGYLDEMKMDAFWDIFEGVAEAKRFFQGRSA